MELRQLESLMAIADHGTFSAAARSLHTVQSNVSAHIARLERELGAPLVDRANGGLTHEGEAVLERARRISRELAGITTDLAELRDEIVGSVRLGVIGTIGRWAAPRLLDAMATRSPGVSIVLVDASTTSLLPLLLSGDLDLAVVNLPVVDPAVTTDVLLAEEHIVIAPIDHPLATAERLVLADLVGHELVLEPRGTAYRDELETAAARAGVTLTTKAEADGMQLVASLSFEGFGPAVVPATAAPDWIDGAWVRIPLDGVAPRVVGIARRRGDRPSAPARTLIDELRLVVNAMAGHHRGITVAPEK